MNKWLFTIISMAIKMASPKIIEDLRRMVQDMVDRAEKTANPWDDIIVGMLQMMIGKPGTTKDIQE